MKAYNLEDLVGYIGGYIGLFLGVALMQMPRLILALTETTGFLPQQERGKFSATKHATNDSKKKKMKKNKKNMKGRKFGLEYY